MPSAGWHHKPAFAEGCSSTEGHGHFLWTASVTHPATCEDTESFLFRQKTLKNKQETQTDVLLPVSVAVHQRELEADEAVQVRVVVPRSLVQEEDVPVGGDEHEAGEAVEAAQHDAHGPL